MAQGLIEMQWKLVSGPETEEAEGVGDTLGASCGLITACNSENIADGSCSNVLEQQVFQPRTEYMELTAQPNCGPALRGAWG